MSEELLSGTVAAHIHHGEKLRILKIIAPKLKFAAGQFTKIGLPIADSKPLLRAYSFVNSPSEELHEFLYDVVTEGGNLTLLLDKLEVGADVLVSTRPNGLLVLKELPQANNLFLIATGTGVGPFLSILKTDEPWQKFQRVTLVYGVCYAADLVYQDLLEQIRVKHEKQFCYLPLVSREEMPGAGQCRVTQLLTSGELENGSGIKLGLDCQFMMCGNPAMIKDMGELLKERGFERNRRARPGNVTIEKYW